MFPPLPHNAPDAVFDAPGIGAPLQLTSCLSMRLRLIRRGMEIDLPLQHLAVQR